MRLLPAVLMLPLCFLQPMEASEPRQLKWAQLNTLVGREVEIFYGDGSTVSGPVVEVKTSALVIEVRKSSNAQAHPKGMLSIDQQNLQQLRVRRERKRGRIIGTISGVVGGVAAGTAAAIYWTDPLNGDSGFGPTIAVFVGVTAGSTAAGYYLGRSWDRGWEKVEILP